MNWILEHHNYIFVTVGLLLSVIAFIYFLLRNREGNTLKGAIWINDIDPNEMACGMKYCPFHRWTSIFFHEAAIESICNLPGDKDGNVLVMGPNYHERSIYVAGKNGENWSCTRRTDHCLKVKPPKRR